MGPEHTDKPPMIGVVLLMMAMLYLGIFIGWVIWG